MKRGDYSINNTEANGYSLGKQGNLIPISKAIIKLIVRKEESL